MELRMKIVKIFVAIFIIFIASPGNADVPFEMPFQGYLVNNDGTPVNGTMAMNFALYDAETGGNSLGWSETQNVIVTEGLFSLFLGEMNPLNPSVFDGKQVFLEVKIDGETLDKRLEIGSTAYSFTAQTALNVPDASDIEDMVSSAGYVKGEGCGKGDVLKWSGLKWVCSQDETGAGGISAGNGINISNTGEISINDDTVELLSKSACYDTKTELLDVLDTTYAPIAHNHDGSYYSKNDTDTKLAGKSDAIHNHDSQYASQNHNHDADYAQAVHNHDSSYAAYLHNHDGLYYGKIYIDSGLSDKAEKSHNHDNAYSSVIHNHDASEIVSGKLSDQRLSVNVSLLGQKIEGAEIADKTILLKNIEQNNCDDGELMKWSDYENGWICSPDAMNEGTAYSQGTGIKITGYTLSVDDQKIREWARAECFDTENELTGLLNDNYAVIDHNHNSVYALLDHNHEGIYSPAEHDHGGKYSLTGHDHDSEYASSGHNHDDRYYTETEIQAMMMQASLYFTEEIAKKADVGHNHNTLYALLLHNHDDRYFTENETNTLLAGYALTGHNHDASDISSGIVPVERGGTGSNTQNFVDLSNAQTISGDKTFSGKVNVGSQTDIEAKISSLQAKCGKNYIVATLGEFGNDPSASTQPAWYNNSSAADWHWSKFRLEIDPFEIHPEGKLRLRLWIIFSSDNSGNFNFTWRENSTNKYGAWKTAEGGKTSDDGATIATDWENVTFETGLREFRVSAYTSDTSKYYAIYKAVLYIAPQ
jgi:hypothetical protein